MSLYPLEVVQQTAPDDQPPSLVPQDAEQNMSTSETRYHKPVRKAAMQARQRVHDWTSELTDNV